MQIGALFSLLVVLGSLTVAAEGANYASGGEYYIASLQHLAQAEGGILLPPPPVSGGEVLGPPPGGGSQPQFFGPTPGQPPSGPNGPVFGAPPGGQHQEQFSPPQGQFGGQQGQPPFPGGQFPSQGQGTQGQFPGQGPNQGQFPGQEQNNQSSGQGQNGNDSFENHDSEIYVNPQEVSQTKRELKDLTSQIKQIGKTKGISENDKSKVRELLSEISGYQSVLNNSSASDEDISSAMQEFHNRQIWDEVTSLRARIQLPQEIKQITRSITRIEKALKTKVAASTFDVSRLGPIIAEMKQQLSAVQSAYGSGQYEEASELMQSFHDNHPGEGEGVVYQILEYMKSIKQIRDQASRAQAQQLLQPIIEEINQGEFRTARESLESVRSQLFGYFKNKNQTRTKTTQ